jgi:predicted site-specific integrase-resolvase
MPVPFRRLPSGTILVDVAAAGAERVVLYARVSSRDHCADLDRQVSGLTEWATAAGMEVGQVVAEVGSGLNPSARNLMLLPAMAPERSPRHGVAEQIGSRETPVCRELGQCVLATDGRSQT